MERIYVDRSSEQPRGTSAEGNSLLRLFQMIVEPLQGLRVQVTSAVISTLR